MRIIKNTLLMLCAFTAINTVQAASVSTKSSKPFGILSAPYGTGENPAIAEYFESMPQNTVYRPLKMPDKPLPVILWGNGGCRDNGLNHGNFLREVASHNFIIIAAGIPREERPVQGPRPAPRTEERAEERAAPAPKKIPDATHPKQLIAGIDWITAQNNNPKSPFYQGANLSKIGVMGHSCGGLQAIVVSADQRIKTSVIFNSGVLVGDPNAGKMELIVEKSALLKFHGPIAYINGGPSDGAYKNGVDDFNRIEHVPAFLGSNNVGHGGTFWLAPNGGEYAQIAAAWMKWHLQNDTAQSKMFLGENCLLCKNKEWTVSSKNF